MSAFQPRPRLTRSLPPAVVTPELYDRLSAFAKDNRASKSEIIRCAVEFFLSANNSKSQDEKRISTEVEAAS